MAPWAASASESASYLVEAALGGWVAPLVPDQPNVWSDGSLVLDQVTGVSSSGAGFLAHQSVNFWDDRRWGHVDHFRPVGDVQSCRGFCSVLGLLQSVQRAEMWGCHFGFAVLWCGSPWC